MMIATSSLLLGACGTLVVYPPAPPGSGGNGTRYYVSIGNTALSTYSSAAPSDAPAPQHGKTVTWTSFDTSAPVALVVAPVHSRQWSTCTVRPLSKGIVCSRVSPQSNAAALTLAPGDQVSIEFDDAWSSHTLLVFANPLEQQRLPLRSRAPNPHDVTFSAGLHDIGVDYRLHAGATVTLEAGAWVRGSFASGGGGADGVTIQGRGILDGGLIPHPPKCSDALALINLCGNDLAVTGITLINAPTYLIELNAFWQPGEFFSMTSYD